MNLTGTKLAHYEILGMIGEGGMGQVYSARDTRLAREVAIKVLPDEVAGDPQRLDRFRTEAQAVAALNHPNIVTIHAVEEAEGILFLVMERIDGDSLDHRLSSGPVSLDDFFHISSAIADGLAAAHARGIVHRDIKAANVMLTADGRVKILDFGLAKVALPASGEDDRTRTVTAAGTILGTPGYMAPEQIVGKPADGRSDVFSTGVVMFSLLTGREPFRRASVPDTLEAVMREAPPSIESIAPDVPGGVAAIVSRCLEKSADARYADGAELRRALDAVRERELAYASGDPSPRPIPFWLILPAFGLMLVLGLVAVWWNVRPDGQDRLAEIVPAFDQAFAEGRRYEAYLLVRDEWRRAPDDPVLTRLIDSVTIPLTIASEPPGAEVFYRRYVDVHGAWDSLGRTPIETRLPVDNWLLRFELDGHATVFRDRNASAGSRAVPMVPLDQVPEGMVRVDAGTVVLGGIPVEVDAFWIDEFEVTNEQFQEFVDAGGYEEPAYWTEPLIADGRELSFDEAIGRFTDTTGRTGPAPWEVGRFPAGKERHPVRGISWYEAVAYAGWAGKSLPTVYHWRHASGLKYYAQVLTLSNFGSDGPAPVGQFAGMNSFGSFDMAGNVREWCWNEIGDDRYTQGGAWDDPSFVFLETDGRAPLSRDPTVGFRLVRYDTAPAAVTLEPVRQMRFDFRTIEPVSDEVYDVLRARYEPEQTPLDARVERSDDSGPHWIHETVSLEPGYPDVRLQVNLFLPRNAEPPYQAVVMRPTSVVNGLDQIDDWLVFIPEWVLRSGRALVVPSYWGTLERRTEASGRDRARTVRQAMDLVRTVDYLQTREDIRGDGLGYLGISAGAEYAAIYLAVEPRFAGAVLVGGGYHDEHQLAEPPEIQPWNFASRVNTPVLMINGKTDFTLPLETAQKPMFEMLGTPAEHKKMVLLDGGHVDTDRAPMIREALDWYDRYMGTVDRKPVR